MFVLFFQFDILSVSITVFALTYFSGEPFSQEELEEMLSAAVDPDKNSILYKDYVSLMSVEET